MEMLGVFPSSCNHSNQVIYYGIVWIFYRKYIVGIYIVPIYYKQHFPFFWLLLNKIDQQYTELQGKCCNRDKHKTFAKSRGKETLYLQNQFPIS